MKKSFCKGLVVVLALIFFVQISGVVLAETELTAWVHPFMGGSRTQEENKMWREFAEGFNEENPGVNLTIEVIPWANRTQKFLTAFSAGKGPDIFYLIPDHIQQFSSQGLLAPLEEILSEEFINEFHEGAVSAGVVDGSIYGLPILQTVNSYFYNLDLLERAGWDTENLPETWEEFYEMSKMVKEKTGAYGRNMTLGNTPNMEVYPYIWQAGGDILDKDGNVVINSEETVEALSYMRSLYENNLVPRDALTSSDQMGLYRQGYIAAYFADNVNVSALLENEPDFEWTIGPLLENEDKATYGTIGSMVISSQSKNKELAADFLDYFTREKNLSIFLKNSGYFPTKAGMNGMFDDNTKYTKMVEQGQYVLPGVIHPKSRDIIEVLSPVVQGVVGGEYTPEEGAIKLEEVIEEEMSN